MPTISWFLAGGGAQVEKLLFSVLMQLCVIILVARAFGVLFGKMRQPVVVGEIVAGLILGPSVLGKLHQAGWLPGFVSAGYTSIFSPSDPYLKEALPHVMPVLAQLGLVLLLFLIGLEFDFTHLKVRGKAAAFISVTGIVLPFGGGIALGHVMYPYITSPTNPIPETAFLLFLGVAMSITALPILGRMMMEMQISRTRIAAITITSAAIDDAGGWILLATVSALAQSQLHAAAGQTYSPSATVWMIAMVLAFAAFMIFLVRPLMKRWIAWTMARNHGSLGATGLAVLLVVLFVCSMITSKIGIFAIFGAFMLGAVLSTERQFRDAVHATFSQFITVFFLPIFFTYTGLRTDIGALDSGLLWVFAAGVSAVAIAGKLGGCTLAARLGGLTTRESLTIGVMMNTRALMELVVVNVGYDLGVIPRSVFCMLVMMAVLTTLMTTPLLQRAARGTELEEGMRQSGFMPDLDTDENRRPTVATLNN